MRSTQEMPTAPGAELTEQSVPPVTAEVPRNASADRAAVRAFRPRRVVPSVITAFLMLVIGGLVAAEVISALLGDPLRLVPYDRISGWASSTPWSDPSVLMGALVPALLGLLLVLLALIPGRPRFIPVRTGDKDLIIGMRPKGFAHALTHAAEEVPGIDHARVKLLGRTAHVRADSFLHDTTGLADAVRQAVTARIATLGPVRDHPVRVKLREKGERS
ncbi:DUF6286 domain-containing protein [Streptosporangium lutulentum]|uniref:DUF6286 domain-containing protein n=1 Tax=Streptosporangium lutulentum TaxID=1461250 RepID=A0ABT9QRT7_9ACTN|nr:DUF6286 domain-containing protein [Streptosporangium lutulentum]MDP9849461.1 hypothetical protein [Streptosporangium lutulentum]